MDAIAEQLVSEADALSPRATLAAIVEQCGHVLEQRLARRFSTKDQVKTLKRRCETLLKQEDGRPFDAEFAKIVSTANAVFDQLIAEVGTAGSA